MAQRSPATSDAVPAVSHLDIGRPITVGVAGEQHSTLAFAAQEARASDCDVRVVHAYAVPPSPPQVIGAAYGFDIDGSFRASGREVLAEATAYLAAEYGDLVVHPVLEEGTACGVLTAAAETSRLVVLGPDDAAPWYSRLLQSRVSRTLSQVASCPVVVVPDTWRARGAGRGVTLLLDGDTVAHGPLRYAFEQAARHHDVLHVIHVEASSGPPEEAIPWHDMQRLIDSWNATYPHVWVTTKVIAGEADVSTIETLEGTGILVLGRPHGSRPPGWLHRSLARAVIVRADCPVAVVPARYDV